MLASGFAGLGWQIVWTQQAALWLGHEAASVLAVITAFFAGLALGAALLGRWVERSARPARWYAGCEAVIGLWGVVLAGAFAPFGLWINALAGADASPLWPWAVAFGATFLLLLPATAAMGATLPAMARLTAVLSQRGPSVGALYGYNTAGAFLGVLVTSGLLLPVLGLAWTAAVCAGLNLLCAGGAGWWARAVQTPPATPDKTDGAAAPQRRLMVLLLATGFLGIGYEVVVTRVLSQVTEATVYTFAALLAVYLVATAAGAAAASRPGTPRPGAVNGLLLALVGSLLLSAASLWASEAVRDSVRAALGPGPVAAVATEATLALLALAAPAAVMGALFSVLSAQAQRGGLGFSHALAWNTLGAAAAAPLLGVALVPAWGAKGALLALLLGYLALLGRSVWRRPLAWGLLASVLAAGFIAPRLAFIDVPEGGQVLSYVEGPLGAVSVVEDADGVSRLRINNRQQEGSSHSLQADARQALLPMLLHPAPRHALFLGLGTGTTAASAATDPRVQVDAVELLPEVIAASDHFIERWADAGTLSRLHRQAADARRAVRSAGPAYDVIVADNYHPARSGSAALYTVEHFQAVRSRLAHDAAGGGVFCQWLPLHQLDLATLKVIVRTFLAVYPDAHALLATNSLETPVLGLLGTAGPMDWTVSALTRRLQTHQPAADLQDLGLVDAYAVLGSFVAGPQALARLAEGAPLNTDDRAVVAYLAPRVTYTPDSLPRDRLLDLLGLLGRAQPAPAVDANRLDADGGRLQAYRQARNDFLQAGRSVQAATDPAAMLDQVQTPLLAVLQTSPDFRPAYDPLLALASAVAPRDPDRARAVLERLEALVPGRPEARARIASLRSRP